MKTTHDKLKNRSLFFLAVFAAAAVCGSAFAEDKKDEKKTESSASASASVDAGGAGGSLYPGQPGGPREAKRKVTWLGVAVEPVPEAVTAQLSLDKGVGLLVTHVMKDAPAAKAGIQENDVLVKLDQHILVHPAQLRTIVENKNDGDTVTLSFYRKGKEQTATATLATHEMTPGDWHMTPGEWPFPREFKPWLKQFRDGPNADASTLQKEIERAKTEAARAAEKARAQADEVRKQAENLAEQLKKSLGSFSFKDLITIPGNASITTKIINNQTKEATLMDNTGTYAVSEHDGKQYLKATDKSGKVLFDGEIQTPEQRAKVPAEVMDKVKGLIGDLSGKGGNAPDSESKKPGSEKAPQPGSKGTSI
jgi:PDZ domain-containing protein